MHIHAYLILLSLHCFIFTFFVEHKKMYIIYQVYEDWILCKNLTSTYRKMILVFLDFVGLKYHSQNMYRVHHVYIFIYIRKPSKNVTSFDINTHSGARKYQDIWSLLQICLLLFIFLYVSSYVTVRHFKTADSEDISSAGMQMIGIN